MARFRMREPAPTDGPPSPSTQPIPASEPWRWWAVINGAIPLTLLFALLEVRWLFFTTLALCVVATIIVGAASSRAAYVALGVLALLAGFVAPWMWGRSYQLGRAPRAEGISVSEAPQHPEARIFRFSDGQVRLDLAGVTSQVARGRNGGASTVRYTVYPIVPGGWTPREPVAVWTTERYTPSMESPWVEGIVEEPVLLSSYQSAAQASAHKHGFRVHPRSIFLDVSGSADEDLASTRRLALWFWGLPNALWLGVALLAWSGRLRRLPSSATHGGAPGKVGP